jgi:hypothetical protein
VPAGKKRGGAWRGKGWLGDGRGDGKEWWVEGGMVGRSSSGDAAVLQYLGRAFIYIVMRRECRLRLNLIHKYIKPVSSGILHISSG